MIKGPESNGTDEHPALVTRVLADHRVNLTVFLDMGTPFLAAGVELVANRKLAEELLASSAAEGVAFWPDRV